MDRKAMTMRDRKLVGLKEIVKIQDLLNRYGELVMEETELSRLTRQSDSINDRDRKNNTVAINIDMGKTSTPFTVDKNHKVKGTIDRMVAVMQEQIKKDHKWCINEQTKVISELERLDSILSLSGTTMDAMKAINEAIDEGKSSTQAGGIPTEWKPSPLALSSDGSNTADQRELTNDVVHAVFAGDVEVKNEFFATRAEAQRRLIELKEQPRWSQYSGLVVKYRPRQPGECPSQRYR